MRYISLALGLPIAAKSAQKPLRVALTAACNSSDTAHQCKIDFWIFCWRAQIAPARRDSGHPPPIQAPAMTHRYSLTNDTEQLSTSRHAGTQKA